MVTALKEGEIDFIGDVSIDLFESFQAEEGISTNVGPQDSLRRR